MREKLKANAHAIYLPIGKEENFTGLVDLVQNVAYSSRRTGRSARHEADTIRFPTR
jgi:translation elongation factor EF-G